MYNGVRCSILTIFYVSKLVDRCIGFLEYCTFDFSVKHTTGICLSVSIRVRVAVALWFTRETLQAIKEFLISKSKREVGFGQRKSTRISVEGDIEKGRNSDTGDSVRDIDDDVATWNQVTNSYTVLQTSPDVRTTWYGTRLPDI